MSSAFRNFFLTLLLSLIVFGLVAWKLIPSVESALLGPADESVDVSDDASDSGDVSRDDNVSDLPPAENGEEVSCLFVGTNDDGRICSLIVTRVSEDRKIYLSSNISASTYVAYGSDDNGQRYAPLYDILAGRDIGYISSVISGLVGFDIDFCFVSDPSDIGEITALHDGITVNIPYEIRYLLPEFSGLPEEELSDEHYDIIPAGSVVLNAHNCESILNALPTGQEPYTYDYSVQSTVYYTVFNSLFARTDIGESDNLLIELSDISETNAQLGDVLKYGPYLFSNSVYTNRNVEYPVISQPQDGAQINVADVSGAISAMAGAYSG